MPFFKIFGELDTLLTVLFSAFFHGCDFLVADFGPEHFLERIDFLDNFRIQVVKFFQVGKFELGLFECGVSLALESKKFLTFLVDLELLFSDFVLLIKSFQSFNGFFG